MITYIGISGGVGSGKDTLAGGLEELASALWPGKRVVTLGFADLIKEQVIAAFGVPRELAFGSQEDKRKPLEVNPKFSIRDAVKIVGKAYTDVDPLFYTRKAFEAAHMYLHQQGTPGDGVVIFSDVRFPAEADWIRMRGGRVIRLTMETGTEEERSHWTENLLADFGFDLVVDNAEHTPAWTLATVIRELKVWGMVNGKAL